MRLFVLSLMPALMLGSGFAAEKEARFFELRTYYAAPGKLEALQTRFREHTTRLFEKHGMTNIGYWTPLTNADNKLVYLLAYPSKEAREKSWKEFGSDPVWQQVAKESERDGRLVAKVESVYLGAADFSPVVNPGRGQAARVFELRTYQAAPGKLEALLARFRDHTTSLFAKHGMTQVGYWLSTEKKDGAGEKLIYMLAHPSAEACAAAFKAFRADPEWIKTKADSEVDGSLTVANGVQSVLLAPTDFSPAK